MTPEQAFDLAVQHHQAGRLAAAEHIYRQVLAQRPDHADALHLLGVIACQAGKPHFAVELIGRAVALRPVWADAYNNLGEAFSGQGRADDAIAAYRQAIALNPSYAEPYSNLGNALRHKDQLDEAITAYRQAIALRPDFADAHRNLGVALRDNGQLDAAIIAYRQALAYRPSYPEAFCNLGVALQENGQLDEALRACRRAIDLRPGYPEAHYNLGVVHYHKGDLSEAIAEYRRAIALRPSYAEAISNLGTALHEAGLLDHGIAACRQAIALKPDLAEAHRNLAHALLLQGDFANGWKEYDWRWRIKDFPLPEWAHSRPRWDGSDLSGRILLVYAEQGFGDTIQFIRYISLVKERCGQVIVACQPALHRLLQSMPEIERLIMTSDPLPPVDVHCPLMSLPLALGTTLQTIPTPLPYLQATPEATERWQKRLDEDADTTVEKGVGVSECRSIGVDTPGAAYTDTPTLPYPVTRRSAASSTGAQHTAFRVGLAWAGTSKHTNDRNRSMQLSQLAPLAAVQDVHFFSLQLGEPAEQVKNAPAGMTLVDWTDDLHDFADTAALIANLDLVICVDTAVAHLAGAMGKPVWVLLPFVPDWRWLLNREDCPWYPTMRLFRQRSAGDWIGVVVRVGEALRRYLLKTEHWKPKTETERFPPNDSSAVI